MANRTVAVTLTADVLGYESAMGRASKATTGVADAGDKASGRLKQAFNTAGKTAGTLFNMGLAGSTVLLTNLGKTGVAYNSLQQNSRAALQVILGDTEAVNRQMRDLDNLVSKSPFGKDTFISAQQQLLAFGYAAEDVIPTLDAVQNAVAATGGSSQKLAEIVYVLAQVQAAGKVTATDLMQLGQRGVDAATIVGSQMGKTGAEIREMITEGEISVDEFLSNLTTGLQEQFGGATDAIKEQWTGATDRIKAAWRETGSAMMDPFITKTGGGQAVVWANDFADALGAVRDRAGMMTTVLMQRAEPALSKVTPLFQAAERAVDGITFEGFNSGLDTMGKYAVPLSGTAAALAAMGTQIPLLSRLGLSINPVAAAMVAVTAASPELRGALGATWDAFEPGIKAGGTILQILGDLTNQVVSAAAPGLEALGVAGAKGVVALLDLVAAGAPLIGTLTPVVGLVADLVGVVADLPGPVLLGAAALLAFRSPLSSIPGLLANAAARFSPFTEEAKRAYAAGLTPLSAGLAGVRAQAGGVGGAFRRAGGALVGAFGGPVMLGITAGVAGLAAVLSASAESARTAEEKARAYGETLDQVSGQVTKATEDLMIDNMVDSGWADKIEKWGGDLQTAFEVMKGVEGAKEELRSQMKAANPDSDAWAQDFLDFEVWGNAQRISIDGQKEAIRQKNAASKEGAAAEEAHAQSMKDSAAAADRAADAVEKYANARRASLDATYATQDAIKRLNEAMEQGAHITRDANGNLDLYSETSRQAVEPLGALVDSINRGAQALIDQGATQEEVNAYMAEQKQLFYDNATAAGAAATETGEYGGEVELLAGKLGLIPSHVATAIDISANTELAEADLESLLAQVWQSHGAITIDATNDPALATLAEALGLTEVSTGVFAIDANTDPSYAKLLMQLGIIDTSTGTLKIDANTMQAAEKNRGIKIQIDNTTGTVTINAKDNATTVLSGIKGLLDSLRSKEITVTTNRNEVYTTTGVPGRGHSTRDADGGINIGAVPIFNNGGFRLPSQAKIQRPMGRSGLVQWAEDEAGPEAFIPMALSKRKRAEQVLALVARGFGGAYVKGTDSFADGGVAGVVPTAGSADLGNIIARLPDDQVQFIVDRLVEGFEYGATRVVREWV